MPTVEIVKGNCFEIRGWVKDGECQVLDFLSELAGNGNPEADRLLWLIRKTAENGVSGNIRHVRSLGDEIFEFKGNDTARVLFFYDRGKLIICSHGFAGKKGNEKKFIKDQKAKAVVIRAAYFAERG
ncbi:MAG: type II toxin-antitoxin system RelE/ParE family toxin [Pyrinomonadaceae bacterium]|nr:type II toxin-antitoxin system RelE/ParE family toxin [Pyrinomonadaceae bacterium]MBP6212718.1 type II toxin-antitoxin system RelE/ParE family toxin [Pyrinomonadaceae bacterium]